MANQPISPGKSKATDTRRPAAVAAQAPSNAETVVAAAPSAAETAPPVAATPAVVETPTPIAATKPAAAGGPDLDPALWSKKSFDLWAENAAALLEFAEGLSKVKTVDEFTSLHSRFVSERLDSFMRQSTEFMTLAQRLMTVPTAPLSGARAA